MRLLNLDEYREVFGFPVYDYYRTIGFDFVKDSFTDLSLEFIREYNLALADAPLSDSAEEVLAYFAGAGKQHIIVSAMQQDMLVRSVEEKGLRDYFSAILGIGDIYASDKSAMAADYVKRSGVDAAEIVFIGDTVHDFEVAAGIGCRCILIADGHQSEQRLKETGAEVIPSLVELLPSFVRKSF